MSPHSNDASLSRGCAWRGASERKASSACVLRVGSVRGADASRARNPPRRASVRRGMAQKRVAHDSTAARASWARRFDATFDADCYADRTAALDKRVRGVSRPGKGRPRQHTSNDQEAAMALYRPLSLLSLLAALLLSVSIVTASAAPDTPADETLTWNPVMLDAIVAGTLGNPQAIRMAATVNTAMFDARTGVSRHYTPIFATETAPPGTHRRAAVVQAAYTTLKSFYPDQLPR